VALIWADRVRETSATSGTGAITPTGAYDASFVTIGSQLSPGDTGYFGVRDGAGNWNAFLGTWNGTSVARTSILSGSDGTNPVNLSGTDVEVWLDAPADWIGTRIDAASAPGAERGGAHGRGCAGGGGCLRAGSERHHRYDQRQQHIKWHVAERTASGCHWCGVWWRHHGRQHHKHGGHYQSDRRQCNQRARVHAWRRNGVERWPFYAGDFLCYRFASDRDGHPNGNGIGHERWCSVFQRRCDLGIVCRLDG
jgi:hypothetical protein